MKKHISLLPICATLVATPLAALTSCGQSGQKLEHYAWANNYKYLASKISVSDIYKDQDFSFNFSLEDNCYIDWEESYVKVVGHHSHSFTSPLIDCSKEGNKYTFTVNKSIVQEGYVFIYISAYKVLNLDTTGSSSDIEFIDALTPYPIEDNAFLIGFKVLNNKALDLYKSTITVGSTVLTSDYYSVYDTIYNSQLYTFINIPADYVKGDITLKLVASDAVSVSQTSYPEYKAYYLNKQVAGNNFFMYFVLADSDKYKLDTDNAVIKVGDTTLTTEDYMFSTYYTYVPYLIVFGDVINGNISVDVPVVELFDLYANKPSEYATVEVEGEKIVANKQYSFTVTPLYDKDVVWDHASTYISVGDKKLTKGNGFSVSEKMAEGYYRVTVDAQYAIDDMYCHFITA